MSGPTRKKNPGKEEPHKEEAQRDAQNRAAHRINPSKSGIRTGNPQLDPEHARKTGSGTPGKERKRAR